MTSEAPAKSELSPGLRLLLDLGPLLVFFVANTRPALFTPLLAPLLPDALLTGERAGIFVATAVFMVAILAALAVPCVTRHLAVMPIVTAIIVLVFGSLTLVLHDETFIKLKPTIIYLLFGGVLIGGLALGKPLLGMVFDSVFNLTAEGWRKLTLRWALFFFTLAVLNEIVWRISRPTPGSTRSVSYLTFVFAAAQVPLLMKYAVPETGEK
jgi:intracellular septation protein